MNQSSNDPLRFEERAAGILATAATTYEDFGEAATDYLKFFEGASLEDQYQLFALLVSNHRLRLPEREKMADPNSYLNDMQWQLALGRVYDVAIECSMLIIQENDTLEQTAQMLWDFLKRYEGVDLTAALGSILSHEAILPYAQLPSELVATQKSEVYDQEHNCIIPQLAILHRLKHIPGVEIIQAAVAMERLLQQIGTHEARVALLADYCHHSFQMFQTINRLERENALMRARHEALFPPGDQNQSAN